MANQKQEWTPPTPQEAGELISLLVSKYGSRANLARKLKFSEKSIKKGNASQKIGWWISGKETVPYGIWLVMSALHANINIDELDFRYG